MRRPRTLLAAALVLALALGGARPARAGDVTGKVTYDGPAPAPTLAVAHDQGICGREVPDETLLVRDGALRNVVVWVANLPGPVTPVEGALLDQRKCVFVPHVQALTVGTELAVNNGDRLNHNVHAVDATAAAPRPTVFNWGMPLPNRPRAAVLRRPGILATTCDAGHAWMSAYVHVFDHPYFAVTGEDGTFRIAGVPDGARQLVFWHETLGTRTAEATVKDGAVVNLVFRAPPAK